jgi:hypothetical protein
MSKENLFKRGCAENERNDNEYWFYNVYHSMNSKPIYNPNEYQESRQHRVNMVYDIKKANNQNISKDPRTQLFIQT